LPPAHQLLPHSAAHKSLHTHADDASKKTCQPCEWFSLQQIVQASAEPLLKHALSSALKTGSVLASLALQSLEHVDQP
jgi:hypothetical protein